MKKDLSRIVAKFLWEIDAIKVSVEKPFQMASGKLSPFYIDCRLLISYPLPRSIITEYGCLLYDELGLDADYIAGGETAGIPFAAWLAEKLRKPFVYVRKKPKGYGLTSQLEGKIDSDKSVLLYEDLITDGKSKLNFISGIRNAGCSVKNCLVVFDRQEGGGQILEKEGVALSSIVTLDECLLVGVGNHYISSKDLEHINEYRNG